MRRAQTIGRVGVAITLVATLALAGVNCGSQDDESFFGDSGDSPCDTVYAGKCGTPCTVDDQCFPGLYCGPASTCTADCVQRGKACSNNVVCSARGRCGPDPSDGGGLVDAPPDGASDGLCVDITLALAKVVPTVVLLVDQSSSMNGDFNGDNAVYPPGPNSRWVLLREALMAPAGVVKKYEGDVEFGLALYSANNGNERPPAVAQCPIMTSVKYAKNNHAAMLAEYLSAEPIDDTPTGNAVRAAAGIDEVGVPLPGGFAAEVTGRPKVIVLATDGEPGRCGTFDELEEVGTPESQKYVVDAVKDTFARGIRTYVITVGTGLSEPHQQEVANAGVGLPYFSADAGADADAGAEAGVDGGGPSAPLFRTTNQAELAKAFDSIIYGIRTCTYTLNGTVAAGQESKGDVKLNNQPLGYRDPNGWKLNSPTEIEFVGDACNTIKTTDAQAVVRFPCGAVILR